MNIARLEPGPAIILSPVHAINSVIEVLQRLSPSSERIAERKLWTFGFTPGRCLRIIRHYVIDIGYWAGIYRVLRDPRFMNNSSTINCNLKRDTRRPGFTIVSFIIGMLCVSRLVPRVQDRGS